MSCHKSGAIRKFDVQTYEFVSRLRIKNSGRIKVREFACSTLVTRRILFFLLRAPPSQCRRPGTYPVWCNWPFPLVFYGAFQQRGTDCSKRILRRPGNKNPLLLSKRLAMKSAEVFLVLIEEKSIVT